MAFTFRCRVCKKRFFFSSFSVIENNKLCNACNEKLEKKLTERREAKKQSAQDKKKLKRQKERLANEKLRDELMQKTPQKEKKPKKKLEVNVYEPPKEKAPKKQPTLEEQAELIARSVKNVLYVYVDVKRVRAIEWINGKKRIALNKERELRKTHKGGWSQEKFQKFVRTKKNTATEWIEDVLTREGVLRGPYEEIVIDCKDENFSAFVKNLMDSFKTS